MGRIAIILSILLTTQVAANQPRGDTLVQDVADLKIQDIKEKLSLVPIKVETFFNDQYVSSATAFFYSFHKRAYLVTNRHVVTGRNSINGKPHSDDGTIPNKIILILPIKLGEFKLKWIQEELKLYIDSENRMPVWWEHPKFKQSVDVVVIPVKGLESVAAKIANDSGLDLQKLNIAPGMDVFVLGFPIGMAGGGYLPIWKRASLASEPNIDLEKLPKMFIDTATRAGMSGSPVYAQESGSWIPEGAQSIKEYILFSPPSYRFLGVYSGRVGNNELLAQLGIVWKESAIQEIIENKSIGKSSFYY